MEPLTCGCGRSLLHLTANRDPSLQSKPTNQRRSFSWLRAATELHGVGRGGNGVGETGLREQDGGGRGEGDGGGEAGSCTPS